MRGREKDFMRKSISFGGKSEPARILVKKFEQLNGEGELSKFIRYLVVEHLSKKSAYKGWKIKSLVAKRKELSAEIKKLVDKRTEIDDELRKEDVDVEGLFF